MQDIIEPTTYSSASPIRPCSRRERLWLEKVEKVVNPPHTPTVRKSCHDPWLQAPIAAPISIEPSTLAHNVPHRGDIADATSEMP